MNERTEPRGYVLVVAVRVVLLLAVLAQVTFLGSRYRLREDLTADRLYTLTESTQKVLDGLDDRLLIEAYFTRDERLPGRARDARRELRALLDEYERRGKGKVVVQYFDPQSDTTLREKAERIGIQVNRIEDVDTTALSVREVWQGLRLRYGGQKQSVIPVMPFQASSFYYEAALTPRIKELAVTYKPKVAVLGAAALATPGSRTGKPRGYDQVKEAIGRRYEVSDLDLGEGKLVPEDTDIVVLIRPKDLTDRQKYALDQYLMGGGKLVVFADTNEVAIGERRTLTSRPISNDATDAKLKFADMLAHWGVRVQDKVVVDMYPGVQERFFRARQTNVGQMLQGVFYPYCFFPAVQFRGPGGVEMTDWAQLAEQLSRDAEGRVDEEKAATLRQTLLPGLDQDNTFSKTFGVRGPGMFWPCPVDLTPELPEGVTGEVLMRTSPLTIVETTPFNMNPLGLHPDPREQDKQFRQFYQKLSARLMSEPRRQVGLMVALEGSFPSFFADKERPPRVPGDAEKGADAPDPLKEEVRESPVEKQEGEEEQGPEPPPAEAGAEGEQDPPFLARAEAGARLVVVGDVDFIRDDILTGEYRLGPASHMGAAFFVGLMDWLAEDQDLVALRNKQITDRTVRLGDLDVQNEESPARFQERVGRKATSLKQINIVGPPLLLLVLWVGVLIARRAKKAEFLSSVGSRAT